MASESEVHEKIVKYYEKSLHGYEIVLGGSQHFGFYPEGKGGIIEKKAQELMQDLLAEKLQLKESDLVLDAGCGQGVVSAYLAKKCGCRVRGITIVPHEVHKANALANRMGVGGKTAYSLMDYSKTSFKGAQFDAVYTMETLVHSPNPEKTLREFRRVLKPGGRLAMFEYSISEDDGFSPWELKMLSLVIRGSAMAGLKKMRHNSLRQMLRKRGFTHIKEENITAHVVPSLGKLRALAWLPYLAIKALGLQARFVNETAAVELYGPLKKGLIRYCVLTAEK